MNRNPVTTKKIQFIKSILKNHALVTKENKKIAKYNKLIQHNNKIATKDPQKLKCFLDSRFDSYTITLVHIYYIRLKEVNKLHTKHDKKYENTPYYKTTMDGLEKEFVVSQEAREEGLYVAP